MSNVRTKDVDHKLDLSVAMADIEGYPTLRGVEHPCKIKLERASGKEGSVPVFDVTLYMPAGTASDTAVHMILAKSQTYKVRTLTCLYVLAGIMTGDQDRIAALEKTVIEQREEISVLVEVCNKIMDHLERLKTVVTLERI